jgi:hypothetical protein
VQGLQGQGRKGLTLIHLLLAAVFGLSILGSVRAIAQSADPKEMATKLPAGAYYWTGDSWASMQQITMSGGGAKHVAKMFVPGLTPQMVWTFREPRALVQFQDGKPLFCFKFIAVVPGMPYGPSGRDIVIARFDEKKDHRELQTTRRMR